MTTAVTRSARLMPLVLVQAPSNQIILNPRTRENESIEHHQQACPTSVETSKILGVRLMDHHRKRHETANPSRQKREITDAQSLLNLLF
jgi:hypothetical protein